MTLAQLTDRRTAHPREHYERNLTCTRCGWLVAVFEATAGARTDAEHRFLDPAVYVCTSCLTGAAA